MVTIERDSHGRTYQIWQQNQANSCGVACVWMARGIGSGFTKEMRLVNAQMADAIDTSFDVPQLNGSRRARNVAVTTAGGKTVNLTIYTQKLTDADISMLLNLVNEKLGEDL